MDPVARTEQPSSLVGHHHRAGRTADRSLRGTVGTPTVSCSWYLVQEPDNRQENRKYAEEGEIEIKVVEEPLNNATLDGMFSTRKVEVKYVGK